MRGNFFITKEILKQYNPCREGYAAFCKHFPEGGEYQEILNKAVAEGRFDDAQWLLNRVGKTEDVLEIESVNDLNLEVCFAGTIIFKTFAILKRLVAGCGIKAGDGIEAGWGIKAGCGIEAGEDYGIYAGLRVRISDKKKYAVITASKKPENIICGEWCEKDETI